MIRKLRLKFICVNMLIATVMLTGIFTMVYHFTRYGMETRSIAMLQAVASEPFQHNRRSASLFYSGSGCSRKYHGNRRLF